MSPNSPNSFLWARSDPPSSLQRHASVSDQADVDEVDDAIYPSGKNKAERLTSDQEKLLKMGRRDTKAKVKASVMVYYTAEADSAVGNIEGAIAEVVLLKVLSFHRNNIGLINSSYLRQTAGIRTPR